MPHRQHCCHLNVTVDWGTQDPQSLHWPPACQPSSDSGHIDWTRPGHHDDKVKPDPKNTQGHSINVPLSFRSDRVEA